MFVGQHRMIARDEPRLGFAPPKQAVLGFCESAAECDVEDNVIIVRQEHNPMQVLSDTEQVILNVFRTHGPGLSLSSEWTNRFRLRLPLSAQM
jgi:hypothetical protein